MSLYIKETGERNENVLIFLHELNMAGWMWNEQVKAFPDFHCMVPDLPGHGRSNEVAQFTMEVAANKIIGLIEQKGRGRAHLVGMALGGQVVLEILNKAPDLVCSAFISGALVNSTPPSEKFLELLDYLMDAYIPVKNDHLIMGSYIRAYGIPRNQIRNFKQSTNAVKPDSARRILKENLLFKIPAKLNRVDVPVMLMAGEKDYTIIKESTRKLADIMPNSKAFLAPGAGHIWNIEKPELFNKVLRSWITGSSLPDNLIEI